MGRFRKSYRIMVFNGGGIFGYIPAHFLAALADADKDPTETLYAAGGTSIGGISALTIGTGSTYREFYKSFLNMAESCFPRSLRSRFDPWHPKHPDYGLNASLQRILGSAVYGDLKMPVIVPSVDFRFNKPKIYDNITNDGDLMVPAWEIARASAAAPTYFTPWKNYIDGGLLSNMPVLETACALKNKLGIPFDRMCILVMGTGLFPAVDRDMSKVRRWSALNWLHPLIKYLTKANEMQADFLARQMGFKHYDVWNPVMLNTRWEMNDPSLLDTLRLRCEPYEEDFKKAYEEFLEA